MAEFVMPSLGADMSAGTLIEWRKKVGDRVTKGEIIAEVDTDKAAIEIESFTTGVIEQLLVEPGTKVPVGTVMAIIREEGTARGERPMARGKEGAEAASAPPTAEPRRLRISPAAKQLAAELGIDPSTVQGTGPGARSAATTFCASRRRRARGSRVERQRRKPAKPSIAKLGCGKPSRQR